MTTNTKAAAIAMVACGALAAACGKKTEGPGTVTAPTATGSGLVHCGGVNACAGKSACKTPKNACAGKNACKGQGVVAMTAEECRAQGGTLQPKMM